MPKAPVVTQVHQPLDVQRHITTEVSLHPEALCDGLTDSNDLLIREILSPDSWVHLSEVTDLE